MKTLSNKSKVLSYIIFMYFIFILINGPTSFNTSNSAQLAFSKSHTPTTNSSKQSLGCNAIGFTGPTYTGPDGCPRLCPSSGNIPSGCPSQNPNAVCPNIGILGPTFKGPDGCQQPCPSSGNIPSGCPSQSESTINK